MTDAQIVASWWFGGDQKLKRTALEILAGALRSPLPLHYSVRLLLADYIEPRPRGNRSKQQDHRRIAAHIWRAVKRGDGIESGIAAAKAATGCKKSVAFEAWATWRPIFEKHSGKLKLLTAV